MYTRSLRDGALLCVVLFAVGISVTASVRRPVIGTTVLTVTLAASCVQIIRFHRDISDSGRTSARRILSKLHRRVALLTEDGYELLIPRQRNQQVMWLRVGMTHNGSAILEVEEWNGNLRRYSIQGTGSTILRSVLGNELSDADRSWCHEQLTDTQLKQLLNSLQTEYDPLASISLA